MIDGVVDSLPIFSCIFQPTYARHKNLPIYCVIVECASEKLLLITCDRIENGI